MPRKKQNQFPSNPVHITARCPNREPFPVELDHAWAIMEDFLYYINKVHSVSIHSFVLMPNHFHMIASAGDTGFGPAMQDFMFHTSLAMNRLSGRINQRWGDRHFRCELTTNIHMINAYKYVYQNPVRAGLVSRCENWKYSTLHGLLGKSRLIIPAEEDPVLFGKSIDWKSIDWLNKPIESENLKLIRTALRKTEFGIPVNQKTRRRYSLETNLA